MCKCAFWGWAGSSWGLGHASAGGQCRISFQGSSHILTGEEGGEWMGFKGMLRSFRSQPLVPAGPVSLGISSRISRPLPAGRSEGRPCKCCVSLSCCLIPTSIYIFENRGGRDLRDCFKPMKTTPLRWVLLPQQQILPEFFF